MYSWRIPGNREIIENLLTDKWDHKVLKQLSSAEVTGDPLGVLRFPPPMQPVSNNTLRLRVKYAGRDDRYSSQ